MFSYAGDGEKGTEMDEEQGYTDGGNNPHYDGLFQGETDADKERRLRWAINEDQLPWPGMMTAFEKYYKALNSLASR